MISEKLGNHWDVFWVGINFIGLPIHWDQFIF